MTKQTDPQDTPYHGDVVPQTSLRLVDEAVVEWLSTLRLRAQNPKVVVAWRSRQFGQQHEIQNDSEVKKSTGLPYITLAMTGITPALDRRVVANIANLGRNPQLWNPRTKCGEAPNANLLSEDGNNKALADIASGDKSEIYVIPFPIPFDIRYQIDFFAKTRQDLRAMAYGCLARFQYADELFLKICVPGYGSQLLPIIQESLDDTTDLETGEAERALRHTLSITAKAWIYQIPIRKKTLLKADVAIFDASGVLQDPDFLDFYCSEDHYLLDGDGTLLDVDESTSPYAPPRRTLAILNFENGSLTGSGPPDVV